MERDIGLLFRVACMYYIQSGIMEAITHHMGVPRSTVSRLSKEAKDRRLAHVTITDPDRPVTRLAEVLRKNFHIQARLANVRPGFNCVSWLEWVVKAATRLPDGIVTGNDVTGMTWGTIAFTVTQHLRSRDLSGVTMMSLNGGVNHRTTGLPYVGPILRCFAAAFHGEEQFLALPTLFGNPGTRIAIWAERSTHHMLQVRISYMKTIFRVEGLGANPQSHVHSANYLDDSELVCLKSEGVVGDVCTAMLRVDGSWRDLPINSRATGMTPAELRTTPHCICTVSGMGRAVPALGALHAGVATDLVADEKIARAILHEMRLRLHFDQILRIVDSRFWSGRAS